MPGWRRGLSRVGIGPGRSLPTWALGLIVALLGWQVGMRPPGPGLDASWNAGLAMAVHEGLRFGREIVFSYGPLGFLQSQLLWYSDLGVVAFLYSASLYLGFCIALCWALRRHLPALAAAAIAFAIVALLPLLEQALLVAALASFALLERERPRPALEAFWIGAALLGGVVALIKLSVGPVIVVLLAVALIGARAGPWRLAAFAGLLAAQVLVLWAATGQALADLPDFLANTVQVASGYSEAMLRSVDVAAWKVTAATLAAALISALIVLAASQGRYRDRRARLAGIAIAALASFLTFKQGLVRTDAGHLTLYFSTACVLWIALPWKRAHLRWMLAGAAAIAIATVPVRPPGAGTDLNALANLKFAGEQARALASPARRAELIAAGRRTMRSVYRLDPAARDLLRDRSVAIEPWEAGVAWAYDLRWEPLPIFQNYGAYTARLDRLNTRAAASPRGPERILRENQLLVFPEFPTPDLDERFPGWDPPAQARAVLCNFAPLRTTPRWQVLGRVPDRCGSPRPAGTVTAAPGEPVAVPEPGPDQVVFARVEGAQVAGLERLATGLLHARLREATVNGATTYRLVPGTAANGLLLRAGPGVELDEPFSPVPDAATIALSGTGRTLRYSFYAMRVAPEAARPQAGAGPDRQRPRAALSDRGTRRDRGRAPGTS